MGEDTQYKIDNDLLSLESTLKGLCPDGKVDKEYKGFIEDSLECAKFFLDRGFSIASRKIEYPNPRPLVELQAVFPSGHKQRFFEYNYGSGSKFSDRGNLAYRVLCDIIIKGKIYPDTEELASKLLNETDDEGVCDGVDFFKLEDVPLAKELLAKVLLQETIQDDSK